MKNLIIPLSLLLFSITVFSQSKEDYTNTVNFINKAFNEKQTSLIYQKFSPSLKTKIPKESLQKTLDSLYTAQGSVSGFELIVDEEKEKNYLVEFDNNSMLMILFLSKDGEISKFKITEY